MVGGSVNKNGSLIARAEQVGSDTALARIVRMVEQAQGSKPPIARLADNISAVFVPAAILIALTAAVIWLIAGEQFPLQDEDKFRPLNNMAIYSVLLVVPVYLIIFFSFG